MKVTSLMMLACVVSSAVAFGGQRGGHKSGKGSGTMGKGSGKGSGIRTRRPGWMNHTMSGSGSGSGSSPAAYKTPKGWTLMKEKFCPRNHRAGAAFYKSFPLAQAACAKNSTCSGILDLACRHSAFILCTGGTASLTTGYANCVVQNNKKKGKPAGGPKAPKGPSSPRQAPVQFYPVS